MFRCFELKTRHIDYPNAEFEIEDTNSIKYKHDFNTASPNIKVFNTDFISDNIELDSSYTKPIIWIGKESKEIKEKIEELNEEFKNNKDKIAQKEKEFNDEEGKESQFFTDTAREIKNHFLGSIHASLFANFNKTNVIPIWGGLKKLELDSYIFEEAEFKELKAQIKENYKKPEITEKFSEKSSKLYYALHKGFSEIINRNITQTVIIERLKDNPTINKWVEEGLKIHQNTNTCEFCGNIIDSKRLEELNQHFSEEYDKLMNDIEKFKERLEKFKIEKYGLQENELYEDLQDDFKGKKELLNKTIKDINTELKKLNDQLDKKSKVPFKINDFDTSFDLQHIMSYNNHINDVADIVEKHNKRSKEHDQVTNNAKEKLQKHFIAKSAKEKKLTEHISNIEGLKKVTTELAQQNLDLNSKIKEYEEELANDRLAIEEINYNLERFLGSSDIKLERLEGGGYELKRNEEAAKNLSEGEKTSLALVYFIAKLKENNNKISDTIIVIDDPISSFDSNRLFHANYFIKAECETANQLFILTHNFQFFALLKDWIDNKKSQYYYVKTNIKEEKRQSFIKNADNIIKHFDSEYHFLFNEVKNYINSPDKSYISNHAIANICRQLLESFLTFKYGRKKLSKCFDEINDFKEINKVRKFVNHFSHRTNHGGSIKGFNDILIAEADKIVPFVFDLIKHLDPLHFDSMKQRINGV